MAQSSMMGREGDGPGVWTHKSDFILAHAEMPVKEVVARARDAGLTLSRAYVYMVRAGYHPRRKRAKPRAGSPATGGSKGAEGLVLAVVAEIGLGRAIALLERRRQMVLEALGAGAAHASVESPFGLPSPGSPRRPA